ncbi:hypothetical protein HanIR_Chr16g0806361 [Helianthus annuus]|nr:hypothetical protein HanIR_Chr16g0806361 [Helianthus annuus]
MIPSVRASMSLFFPKNLINSMFGSIKYLNNTLSITHLKKPQLQICKIISIFKDDETS